MNFAVFASGNGGNLQAIINAVKAGKIKARLNLVFSDKPQAFALVRAKKAKVPVLCLDPKGYPSRAAFDKDVIKRLKEHGIEFIVMAGYMRLLSACFFESYAGRIINIHPSLLPSFKGTHGIKDAFDYGVKVTGVTVHYVVEEMDAGRIIAQVPVEIKKTDTLASLERKIHAVEHKLYPAVIAKLIR